MARVTIEDCLEKVGNMYELVHLATKRSRQLYKGSEPLVKSKNRVIVTALRGLALAHGPFSHPLGQRLPLDQRHGDVIGPVDLPGVKQRADVGVTQSGDGLGLALEPLAHGVAAAGGYEAACRRLGLPASDAAPGAVPDDERALQATLRAALRRASRTPSPSPVRARGAAPMTDHQLPNLPAGLSRYLGWME